mmetsp:Transcript_11428/g.34506  ORF Transcript_11428/g.34506 Transcript_11428/m.34506 type:complete len:238 (+) Transcript_11428:289-1002(+)
MPHVTVPAREPQNRAPAGRKVLGLPRLLRALGVLERLVDPSVVILAIWVRPLQCYEPVGNLVCRHCCLGVVQELFQHAAWAAVWAAPCAAARCGPNLGARSQPLEGVPNRQHTAYLVHAFTSEVLAKRRDLLASQLWLACALLNERPHFILLQRAGLCCVLQEVLGGVKPELWLETLGQRQARRGVHSASEACAEERVLLTLPPLTDLCGHAETAPLQNGMLLGLLLGLRPAWRHLV